MPEFFCCLCIYEDPRRNIDEDERAERAELTVVNGHMVCMAHLGYAANMEHSRMISAIRRRDA
jgi:hypothetical protein